MTEPLVWYAAYGSNLAAARFRCYVVGGRPAGAARTYPERRGRALLHFRWVVTGLHESHGMRPQEVAEYLAECPGIGWDTRRLETFAAAVLASSGDEHEALDGPARMGPDVADVRGEATQE